MTEDIHHHEAKVPVWVLAPMDEKIVIDRVTKKSREVCKQFVEDFVECSKGNILTVGFRCGQKNKAMMNCLTSHNSTENIDKERNMYIAEKVERLRKQQEDKA